MGRDKPDDKVTVSEPAKQLLAAVVAAAATAVEGAIVGDDVGVPAVVTVGTAAVAVILLAASAVVKAVAVAGLVSAV